MSTTQLTGTAQPVALAHGFTLYAPGVRGTVFLSSRDDLQAAAERDPRAVALAAGFAAAGIDVAAELGISVAMDLGSIVPMDLGVAGPADLSAPKATGQPQPRGTPHPPIHLAVPDFGPYTGCALLFTDDAGLYHWLLPRSPDPQLRSALSVHGSVGKVFALPPPHLSEPARDVPSTAASAGSGPLPGMAQPRASYDLLPGTAQPLARSTARVLTWSTRGFAGQGATALARQIEAPVRPYGFRLAGPGGWSPDIPWAEIDGRRTLLLLHGMFSTAEIAFHALVRPGNAAFEALLAHYDGRVLAFNHPSLYHAPAANAQALLKQLPAGIALDLDILTHSRGALVARELVERPELVNPYGRGLRVHRVVFVAAPQRGTVLADGEHWQELLDRSTDLAALGPTETFRWTIEGIAAALKLLARGVLGNLPGLACLNPQGDYLARLNTGAIPEAVYYALSGRYAPTDAALRRRFSDTLFGEPNDGVVPTAGGYATGLAAAGFPLPPERYRVLDFGDRLYHTAYFEHDAIDQQVAAWLGQGAEAP